MPKIEYVAKRFGQATLAVIETADAICQEYADQGYDLTLRQLYYQFVARGLLVNAQTEYKRLGSIVNDARLAGLIDWNHVTDRTRNLRDLAHWDAPEDIISASASQYRTDRWDDQPYRVEVWVEKDALTGVISRSATALDVPWFSCRGYTSQSEVWGAAMRHRRHERNGQKVVVIHLGDHDPSGIDMTRDITDRLALFGAHTEVKRIALNMNQVDAYDPPPNPAKLTDSRAAGYIDRYGSSSWELDALDPGVLDALINSTVSEFRDEDTWSASTSRMMDQRQGLQDVYGRWDDVVAWVREQDEAGN